MEPLHPDKKEAILRAAPQATAADLAEYERLLSKRYSKEPPPKKPHAKNLLMELALDPDEARLKELTQKLFGKP